MKRISVLIFILVTFSTIMTISGSIAPAAAVDNSDWHTGSNLTTADYTVNYVEESYSSSEFGEQFRQTMTITYLDGTGASQGVFILNGFNQGGVDVANNRVVDWGKYNRSDITFFTQTKDTTGMGISSRQSVNGFKIFKGISTNLQFENVSWGGGKYWFIRENSSAQLNAQPEALISFTNGTCKIGPLTMTTSSYTYEGKSYNAVNTKFALNLIGTMSNGSGGYDDIGVASRSFPAVVSYELNHNVTETRFKNSLNLDWSSTKAFTTRTNEVPLATDDSYFLVSNDLLEVSHDTTSGNKDLKQYAATADNATTIYTDGDKEICRQNLAKTFSITGGNAQSGLLCSRYYIFNGRRDTDGSGTGGTILGSQVFVAYDGFKYNNSTGLLIDPEVIVPCYLQGGSTGIGFEFTWVTTLMGIGVAVVILRFRKRSYYT